MSHLGGRSCSPAGPQHPPARSEHCRPLLTGFGSCGFSSLPVLPVRRGHWEVGGQWGSLALSLSLGTLLATQLQARALPCDPWGQQGPLLATSSTLSPCHLCQYVGSSRAHRLGYWHLCWGRLATLEPAVGEHQPWADITAGRVGVEQSISQRVSSSSWGRGQQLGPSTAPLPTGRICAARSSPVIDT